MLSNQTKKQIKSLWKDYLRQGKRVLDKNGVEYEEIDQKRLVAIEDIKKIINTFFDGESDVYSFKTSIDSYNKRNNLWGFTAIKGQMFFNQLVRAYDEDISTLDSLLKDVIKEPRNLKEALSKIEKLETELYDSYVNASDKRKVPKPSSVCYFLSYFWQVQDREKWAILYSSIINAFSELNIWEDKTTQKETYEYFYVINEEIKTFLSSETNSKITNWDVEHCFWNIHLNSIKEDVVKEKTVSEKVNAPVETKTLIKANFDINDYLIPKVSNLVELGEDTDKSASEKGSLFEKKVSEVFKLLDFEVISYGQGTGRNPDAIIKFREEDTAFIVDAKAYSNGYNLGLDDRAIREYIYHFCPKLIKESYKKIGFIIVSNSFKSDFEAFINDITWNTDIKRFILLTSSALLHLLAYKTKDNLQVTQIIDSLIKLGTLITEEEIIGEFEDV
jgi:hypothetical protein